ncbi:MAG TPA: hypothetical protein VF221_23630 [Chloroflexota bacterium]
MINPNPAPTNDDVQVLIDRLIEFDATLTPAQRSLFRQRILATIPGEDVEGHNWEMRWQAGADGIFRQWVYVDEKAPAPPKGPTH